MVTDWFLSLFTSFMNTVASGLPTSNPFQSTSSWGLWTVMDYFLPVHELLGIFAIVFALGGPMGAISMLIWLFVGVIRGGATKA